LLSAAAHVCAAQGAGAKGRLKLELAAAQPAQFVGEPVDLTFTLTNVSDEVVKGSLCMGLGLYNPEVWYRAKGAEKFMLYVGNFPAAADYLCPPEELAPHAGKSQAGRLLYAVNPGSLVLREPGAYEFQARFKLNDGYGTTLESNVVSVEVRTPPDSEKGMLAQWSDPELLDFVQGNVGYATKSKREAGLRKAAKFLEEHEGSVYAAAARQGLLDYLEPRARAKRLTDEEQAIYERLLAQQ
jgi:hypothetical protein